MATPECTAAANGRAAQALSSQQLEGSSHQHSHCSCTACATAPATGRAGGFRPAYAVTAAAVLHESSSSDARHSISGTMIVTKQRYFDIVVVGENRKIWTWPSRAERRPLITNTCKSRVTTSSASLRDLIFLTIFYICTYSLSRELPPLPVLVASSK